MIPVLSAGICAIGCHCGQVFGMTADLRLCSPSIAKQRAFGAAEVIQFTVLTWKIVLLYSRVY